MTEKMPREELREIKRDIRKLRRPEPPVPKTRYVRPPELVGWIAIATYCRLSISCLKKWHREKSLPVHHQGGQVRILVSGMEWYLGERCREAEAKLDARREQNRMKALKRWGKEIPPSTTQKESEQTVCQSIQPSTPKPTCVESGEVWLTPFGRARGVG